MALHVRNLQASIAFYERFTNRPASDESGFVLVLQEGTPHSIPGAKPQSPIEPISYFEFALSSREAVDAVATEGKNAGLLQFCSNNTKRLRTNVAATLSVQTHPSNRPIASKVLA
jgi:hypothetical protein